MDYEKQTEWDLKNTTQIKLKLNNRTDADIIEWVKSLDNKQGTIKAIIRKHIREQK